MVDKIRGSVDPKLILRIREQYPEVKGLTIPAIMDWALRTLLKNKRGENIENID